jgi:transposase InsO family protein
MSDQTVIATVVAPGSPRVPAPPPPPARDGWIDLQEAARRSGLTDRRLRQRCVAEWKAAGLARQQQPPGGGRSQWYVHESADAGLARVKTPDQLKADLTGHSARKRDQALFRLGVLKRLEEAVKAGFVLGHDRVRTTNHFLMQLLIKDGVQISLATLYNWQRAYRADGLAGLVDGRGSKQSAPGADDPFLQEVARLWLNQRQPALTKCYEMAEYAARRERWTVRSYDQTKRYVRRLPAEVVALHRGGPEAHNNRAVPFLERDYAGLRGNQYWCGDHHQFDVIVNAGGGRLTRPWITAWQDVRSRRIVGWHVFCHDPNQDTILLAFKRGVESHYVPENVQIDNGKDYDSYALNGRTKKDRWLKRKVNVAYDAPRVTGLFAGLGVGVTHCEPYHGQSKPIERWFGTMERAFGAMWPTYCGNSPANRPEDLQLQLERGKAPTIGEFIDAFEAWLQTWHAAAHTGDGMGGKSPDVVWTECLEFRQTADPRLLQYLLLKESRPVKVTRNGVILNGLPYGQFNAELYAHLGKEVILRYDPADVTRVLVSSSPDDTPIAWANLNAKIPFAADGQDLRDTMKEKRRIARVAKEFFEAGPRRAESTVELMIRAAADRAERERQAPDPNLPPPPVRPVRSPLEGHLDRLQRLDEQDQQLRKAVGAEGVTGGMDLTDLTSGLTLGDDDHGAAGEDSFMRFTGIDE